MIDVKTRQAPGWYLKRLSDKLTERRKRIDALFDRYEGNAPVPSSLSGAPESAQAFFKASRTSFAEMIVKAVKYPLRIQGVITDADRSSGDLGDAAAEQMMRASGMKSESDDVHRISLVAGDAYAIVAQTDHGPRYTAEDPRQVVTIHDPLDQSRIIAAAKFFWHAEDECSYAYLYTPGRVWRAHPKQLTRRAPRSIRFSDSWEWDENMGGAEGQTLPEGFDDFQSVFRYRNEEGVGEFERHTDLLDRLDHMILQGMTIATLQAFKQRAIRVPEEDMPDEDENGQPIDYNDILTADPGALWKLPLTAEIWESGNVDLTPVWTGVDKFIQQLSAVTFTPLAMFSPDGQNQSAAGAGFAREGRTFKIEDRQDRLADVHARALAALFRLAGDESRSKHETIEMIWRPAERYSLAEKGDAMTKYKAGGVPWRTRMIDVGQYSPKQVLRMESERMSDEILFPAEVDLAPIES